MADSIEFSILGLDPIMAKLQAVAGTVRYAKGRAALRKAGLIIVKAAQDKIEPSDDPSTDRTIKSNIVIQWNNKRFKASGDLAFRIGVRGGARIRKGQPIPDGKNVATPHWRLLEFGTKTMIAKPFLRPAMSNNIQPVTNAFVDGLEKLIDRAIRTGKVG